MRRNYGYGSYRGRGGFRTFLKIVIAILAVALVVLVGGYFLLQQYAVVTDDGIHFALPFLGREKPTDAPEPSFIVETPIVTAPPTPTPTPQRAASELHAVLLPRAALYDGTAPAQVAAAGGNAALFDMKADDGSLGYVSDLALAKQLKTSDANPALNAAITALTEGDLTVVARVSCFKDNAAPYRNNHLALKTGSGYNWKDLSGVRWTSPANGDVQDYLAGVCAELAALGFDEIVLDNAFYPVEGKLASIKPGPDYDKTALTAVIADFYAKVTAALAPYPQVKLSMVGYEGALTGTDANSGQTPAVLAEYAHRVWLAPPKAADTDYEAALKAGGMEHPEERMVTITDVVPDTDEDWCLWPAGQNRSGQN